MKRNSLLPLHYPRGYRLSLSRINLPAIDQGDAPLDSPRRSDCNDIVEPGSSSSDDKPVVGLRKAQFAIQGMTCTSCTSAISSAVESLPGVESVDVHFFSSQAIIIYRPSDIKPDEMINAIEDGGYGAILGEDEDLEPLADGEPPNTRSIEILIHGDNQNCLPIINKGLGQLGLSSFTPITMEQPISRIEYRPSRDLTIRRILDFHEGITASVHHRPSMNKLTQEGQRRETRALSYFLLLSFVITIPTFIIGIVGMTLLPQPNTFRVWCETFIWGGSQRAVVALFVLGTVSQIAVNQYFIMKAWKSLSTSSKGWQCSRLIHFGSMDLLVALSTTVAYLASLGLFIRDVHRSSEETMKYGTTSYFDSSVFLGFFILIGRVLEHHTRLKTNDAIALLEDSAPDHALLLADIEKPDNKSNFGEYLLTAPVTKIPTDHIEVGDFLLLPAGGIPSADGIIVAGSSAFDESSLTGESLPVQRAAGDNVMTGTTNLTAPVVFRVEKVGQETMMQKIVRAVTEGQSKKSPIQVLAERITSVFVPLVVYASLIVLVVWLVVFLTAPDSSPIFPSGRNALGDRIAAAFEFAIATLVIACPCGIGLAAPTAHAVGSGLLAKAGILAQGGGEAFQLASDVDVIVFDKTGTLTMGNATVTQSYLAGEGDTWLWEAVSSAEATSTHPLAQGVVSFCRDKLPSSSPSPLLQPVSCEEAAGRGMRATYLFNGEKVCLSIGNDVFVSEEDRDFRIPDSLRGMADTWRDEGSTVVFVLRRDSKGSSVPLMFGLVDEVRPGFATTISTLKAAGKDVYMLTGDNERTALAVARRVGLDEQHVKASAMPLEKAQFVRDLKMRKRITRSTMLGCRRRSERESIVTFVGDGLNDSAALAAADLGIALSHGSQVTIASAAFIILSDRSAPQAVTQLFRISSKVYRRQMINFGWAMLYNVVLIPVAAGVLYPYRQTQLSPVWSSLAMALSSVSVVVSSLALKWGV